MNNETIQSACDALIALAKAANELLLGFLYSYEPFRKHLHYAIYAKKERVRKKHLHIMLKQLLRKE